MKKGFTLIELLVVSTIITVLIGIASVSYVRTTQSARDAKRKTDLEQIRQALETYRSENGYYSRPSAANQYYLTNPSLQTSLSPYITTIPSDPKNPSGYKYRYVVPGTKPTSYSLYAALENTNDPAIDSTITASCGNATIICNYSVTNP